ncbi:MAG: zinc-dependent metalloprotease [Ilumatobacteraceae bacterium]
MSDDSGVDPLRHPLFEQMARAMAGNGPIHWDVARQTAMMVATGGATPTNVDPTTRIAIERLAPIAELHVRDVTQLDVNASAVTVVDRATWVHHTLAEWRTFFSSLAGALQPPGTDGNDPMAAMLANVGRMIAPAMTGMSIGSMIGTLATTSFGCYDLPLPREPHTAIRIIGGNVDDFAREWSLAPDDVRLWVVAHELATHAVYGIDHVRRHIIDLVTSFAGAFRPDPDALLQGLGDIDPTTADPMRLMQRFVDDPTLLAGAVRSPEQDRLQPVIDAAMTALVGFVDVSVDEVTSRVLGSSSRISEAVRRRRVEESTQRTVVERLLGLHLDRESVAAGRAFVHGVIERGGREALGRMFASVNGLPTPAEIGAPGLWIARVEYD